MNHSDIFKTKTCYYCNLDYINTFVDFQNEYLDKFDLINNCESKKELELIIDIGDKKSGELFLLKGKINNESDFENLIKTKGTQKTLNKLFDVNGKISIDKIKSHNHFTLDHLLPQTDYPHLSLCIYNLIPSCYSCNSKFKKEASLHLDLNDLILISPTSDNNVIDLFSNFNILFNYPYSKEDYKIKLNSKYDLFFKTLKIQGRYNFHKDISFKLLEKRKNYSDSQIAEIAKITKRDIIEVKKDIFGSVIFNEDENNEPFAKYKKDIAKQLGLI